MNKIILFLLMTVSIHCYAFEFKGLKIGKVSSSKEVVKALSINCADFDSGRVICSGSTTIVGASARAYIALNNDKVILLHY